MERAGNDRGDAWVVTLLTDFGHRDPYVGIMKGALLTAAARPVTLVDLTHEVEPQDVAAASFLLDQAWPWFPAGSVHVAVVDPGVGSGRAALLVQAAGHTFLAPDNGLLTPLLGRADALVHELDPDVLTRGAPRPRSATFDGRDVFAPAAGRLAAGASARALVRPGEVDPVRLPPDEPVREGGRLRGRVVLVDRFGDLVTNVDAAAHGLRPGACRVRVAGRSLPLVRTYADAAVGACVALIGSYGRLELAARDGSAAALLGLGVGAEVEVPIDEESQP